MTEPSISYERLVERALRGVLRDALRIAEKDGLPGDHHYYITFLTDHPDVIVAKQLRAQHPDVMTIVLQHQFWGLVITEEWFEVELSFSGRPECLHIPFEAVTAFADPYAKFGLQFQIELASEEDDGSGTEAMIADTLPPVASMLTASPLTAEQEVEKQGKVVTLDAFRKR